MRYLFGDSTESALELNYLALLRDSVEFAATVLAADVALDAGRERKALRERACAEQVKAVEEFARSVVKLVEPVATGSKDAPVGRCAAAIAQAATEQARREIAISRAGLASDAEQIEAEAQRLRGRCVEALRGLLLVQDLPDAREVVTVRWGGAAYEAQLTQQARFGVEVVLELEVPATSLFAHDLRLDKVVDGLDIHAPETAGWIKKETKMVPHRVGKHHVTEVIVDGDGVTARLRATVEAGAPGFDVVVERAGAVRVERTGEGAASFDTDDRDVAALERLVGKLEEAVVALRGQRTALRTATVDGKPLAEHPHPRVIAARLIEAIAPTVREIARHSLAPRELVLKRLLADDRREEIFVTRAELAAKVAPLPATARKVFASLGVIDDAALAEAGAVAEPRRAGPSVPPPSPPPRVSAEQTAAAVDSALEGLEDS